MGIELFRIDDRLIHGQVVVGWGQPLDIAFIVLVDDAVAESDWEQELYRMGVPPEMDVYFESVERAASTLETRRTESRPGLLVTADITSMSRLAQQCGGIARVNLGGIHYRAGRVQKLRYLFLDGAEERELREMAARGTVITAQDVPSARPIPLDAVLSGQEAM